MRIYTLVENNSIDKSFRCEHGLSLFISTQRHNILFDFGSSDLYLQNADSLGVDISSVDFAVISHGHYDHTGGLGSFLEINRSAPIYVKKEAFDSFYNADGKYIGINKAFAHSDRFVYADDVHSVTDQITLFSCNGMKKEFECHTVGHTKIHNGVSVNDDYLHEQYMLIEENGKRVLFTGCSHKGIINICSQFDVDCVIGGFHFSKLPTDEKMTEYAEILAQKDCRFFTCHCTGLKCFEHMKKTMNNLSYLYCGNVIDI